MPRLARIAFVLALFAALVPAGAAAAPHMLIGFQDDPTFRWMPNVERRARHGARRRTRR